MPLLAFTNVGGLSLCLAGTHLHVRYDFPHTPMRLPEWQFYLVSGVLKHGICKESENAPIGKLISL